MKSVLANDVENQAKPAKVIARGRARLAKIVTAKPAYCKLARQSAFSKVVSHLSISKAVSRAKLISEVNPAEFRIVRMPG